MIDNLDDKSRIALVNYRINRAHRTIAEVSFLLDGGLYSTAVNRLYYAVYYAAVALLVNDGINATTHSGVRSMLGLHYIRTGRISREIGNNFMILFERRHSCDYDDFINSTKEDVEQLIPLANSFIEAVDHILR